MADLYDWEDEVKAERCGCGHHRYEMCECPDDCWDFA